MDPITLAALFAAGGTLVSSGVNSIANTNLNKKNREWQEQMYTKYYSPNAQMSQMLSAGINPNLAAQGISGSPGISMPQASNSNNPVNVDFAGAVDTYTKLKLAEAQEKNIKADTENTETDTENKRIQNKYLDDYWKNNVDRLKAEITKLGIDASVGEQILANLKQKFEQNEELFPLQKDKLIEEANEIRKRIDKMDQDIKESEERIELMQSEEAKNYASARRENAAAAVDEFILENGYRPDSIEGQIIKGLVSDDPQEQEDAKKLIDNYNEFVEGGAKAKESGEQEAKNELDPEQSYVNDLTENLNKSLEPIDRDIHELEKKLSDYTSGRKKDNYFHTGQSNIEYRLKILRNKRQNLIDDYNRNLRKRKFNTSYGVGPVRVSR